MRILNNTYTRGKMQRKVTFKSLRIFVQSIGGIRRTEKQYSFLKDTLVKECFF